MSTAQLSLTPVVEASYTLRMETLRYTPIPEEDMKTYIFKAVVEPDEDRWSAYCPALLQQGAATWGHTKEEALHHLEEAVKMVVESLLEHQEPIRFCRKVDSNILLSTICGIFHVLLFQYVVWFVKFATEPDMDSTAIEPLP
jgi:predicted RNase H-like HicB family nuclease